MSITSDLLQDADCVSFLHSFQDWISRADVTFLAPADLQNMTQSLTDFRNRAATADHRQAYLDVLEQTLEIAKEKFLSREDWPNPLYTPEEIRFMSHLEAGVIRDIFPPGSTGRLDNLSNIFDLSITHNPKSVETEKPFMTCTTYMCLKMRPDTPLDLDPA